MALPPDFLDRLKSANPIAEVMGDYVNLKRAGSDYVCLCPFHNERTPSCHVHPDKEYFHCFGCGAGGDVITFVMRYNNLDYWEAVKLLAERGGVPLPEDNFQRRNGIDTKRIYELNKKAARFFYDKLRSPEGAVCREYLAKRGLKNETIKKYGMGFAPNSWSELKSFMLSEGYTEKELEAASLISRSQKNTKNTFDFFTNRAMFPFIDLRGNIVGFGGRTLGDDKRKYLNSKDTPVYNKAKFMFSLNFAKNVSAKSKRLLLCEGNLDVISLNQAGFENAVASCGTALTPEQARLMRNYAEEIVICYDSDEAGQKAAKRAIGLLNEAGLKSSVIHMEGAKDPDEYINKFGRLAFESLLDNSLGAVNFKLAKAAEGIDMASEQGRSDYLKRCCNVLLEIRSPTEREIYISKIAAQQNIPVQAVKTEIEYMQRAGKRRAEKKQWQDVQAFRNRRDTLNPEAVSHPKENTAEQQILYFLLKNLDECRYVSDRLPAEKFVTSLNKRFYESILRRNENNEDCSLSAFNDEFSPEEVGKITAILCRYENMGVDKTVVEDCIRILIEAGEEKPDASTMNDPDFEDLVQKIRKNKGIT